jgi:pseudaminic acid cytidylyltransferase
LKIAVIPARGGSKRIPRKNIRSFCGIPMIARAVQTALASGLFEHVVVSSDDAEIAQIATQAGALVPFVRPPELSDDQTATVPVIAHAVSHCIDQGWAVTHACCIYPCTPLLSGSDMARALDLALQADADFVYPVVEYAHPIQRAMRRQANGHMSFIQGEHELTRTQDLEKTFHDAGQFYWGKSAAWLALKRMHSSGLGLVVPHWRTVDIDTEEDFKRAELIFQSLHGTVQ